MSVIIRCIRNSGMSNVKLVLESKKYGISLVCVYIYGLYMCVYIYIPYIYSYSLMI